MSLQAEGRLIDARAGFDGETPDLFRTPRCCNRTFVRNDADHIGQSTALDRSIADFATGEGFQLETRHFRDLIGTGCRETGPDSEHRLRLL